MYWGFHCWVVKFFLLHHQYFTFLHSNKKTVYMVSIVSNSSLILSYNTSTVNISDDLYPSLSFYNMKLNMQLFTRKVRSANCRIHFSLMSLANVWIDLFFPHVWANKGSQALADIPSTHGSLLAIRSTDKDKCMNLALLFWLIMLECI